MSNLSTSDEGVALKNQLIRFFDKQTGGNPILLTASAKWFESNIGFLHDFEQCEKMWK